jgi:epoxyqueuosine reductase
VTNSSQLDHLPGDDLVKAIRDKALELGLDLIGFAAAAPPARADFFAQWLSEGKAGTMSYLNRSLSRRSDPAQVLEGVKTIISMAESYYTERLPDGIRCDPARGIIASYAWGRDYHEVLLDKLKALAAFIDSLAPQSRSKVYTDTGPIFEREYGERAGLGFIGKNTMLISPRIGSTFFLGEILTTLELPLSPKPKVLPSCGSCIRCQTTCPTHAFPAEYVLDSTLCISYLTIEYKGIIPADLRPLMGNHIFGCDDCQSCCPWNDRFSRPTTEAAYHARLERQAPRLTAMASLTESDFKDQFAESPVLRPGYAGLLRNVAVALGNWGTPEAADSVLSLGEHSSPLVRLHAVWAAGRIAELREWLQVRQKQEPDGTVREELERVLTGPN